MRTIAAASSVVALLVSGCAEDPVGQQGDVEYAVLVSAQLSGDDVDANRTAHDAVAGGSRDIAVEAGDIRHMAFVGLEDPRTFLAIDLWNNRDGLDQFMGDPEVQAAFAGLFVAPPDISVYERAAGWAEWGELPPVDGSYVVTVRGTLASESYEENQAAHDQVARGGQDAASALGDYAHVVYLGAEDSRQFLAVDLWSDIDGLQTFMSDEQVAAGFASLFVGAPTISIYGTTDYLQW